MRIDIQRLGQGVVIRCQGVATVEGAREAIRQLGAFDGFAPSTPAVWDFSEADSGALLAQDMRTIGASMSFLREGECSPRVALLVARDADFASARMFSGVNESQLPSEYRVFRDRDRAHEWALGMTRCENAPTP